MLNRLIWIFGLLIGAAWMGEVLFGNLGDTILFANVRPHHGRAYSVGAAIGRLARKTRFTTLA